eukprot:CAMPEP_0172507420 /NCGR_PEP_ID=MMETSP1066-20121228/203617_1 /TAXON_ID=671091 /ORGANISM="Coscinodiscus wailesii, Strain CCMP2513" /LENGTH=256 /DNA_ID=CAMNT_0013284971 /DNA_START=362 /DNA_END=1132 /DNA_ORIENTATION=-
MTEQDSDDANSVILEKNKRREVILDRICIKKGKRRSSFLGKVSPKESYLMNIENEMASCESGKDETVTAACSSIETDTNPEANNSEVEKHSFWGERVAAMTSFFGRHHRVSTTVAEKDLTKSRCDICLLSFTVQDDICSSHNAKCSHKYHTECIVEWLLDSDKCPCCSQKYFSIAEGTAGEKEMPSGYVEVVKRSNIKQDLLEVQNCFRAKDGLTTQVHAETDEEEIYGFDSKDSQLVIKKKRDFITRKSIVDVEI